VADSKVSDERLADLIDRCDIDASSYEHQSHSSPTPHIERQWAQLARDEGNALRELQQLRSQGWRDIATAPRDGLHVQLYRPRIQFVGYYSDSGWCINAPGLPLMLPPPTHWMPKPEDPPSQERANG
jgi:hypothetical protein